MFRFRYEYQPCSIQKLVLLSMTRVTIRFLLPAKSQVMTPMAPPGISSTTPLKALGKWVQGWISSQMFVTMTFQEKTTLVSSCQAGSNVAVPGADLIYMGWILHVNFRKESLEFLNLRLFCFLQKWWLKWMFDGTSAWRNGDVNWKILFNFRSLCDDSDKNSRKTEPPKKTQNKKMLARVWGLVYVLAFT